MYQGKLRIVTFMFLALYTVLVLYFLYFGFNRTTHLASSMRYNLIPQGIHLHLPVGVNFQIWLFELGNFLAFIPFGIAIPLLYRSRFIRFIVLFVLSITILEIFQMISRLGSFDINDIIMNTLGAAVGYCAQRIVRRDRNTTKGILRIILTACVFSFGVFIIVGGINHYLDNKVGDVVALNEITLKESRSNELTYLLNSRFTKMEGYAAIPAEVIKSARNERIDIVFIADGIEIYSLGLSALSGENHSTSFQIPYLNGANELTIRVINEDLIPNIYTVLQDVTLSEVNTGQKIINYIKQTLKSVF